MNEAQQKNKVQLNELIKKVEELRKSGAAIDLSTEEDLSLAVMNLISIEEHLFFTGIKMEKPEYFNLLDEVRQVRKELLGKMIPRHEGETWCISKHLLAASMRLLEVGTKLHADSKKTEAGEMFSRAYKMYSMFWALRLKLIDAAGFKQAAAQDKPWTFEDIVNKLVDCCDE